MPDQRRELLVVDGYNVIRATERYAHLIDEGDADPYLRAREALLADVAAFAQGSYDPVVVFDGAGNLTNWLCVEWADVPCTKCAERKP